MFSRTFKWRASIWRPSHRGIRGFVVTGKESYLDEYRSAVPAVEQNMTAIGVMTSDNPRQQERLLILKELAAGRIERSERIIAVSRSQGFAAGADIIRKGPGQQTTHDIRSIMIEMQEEEARLLILRTAEVERNLILTKIIFVHRNHSRLVDHLRGGLGRPARQHQTKNCRTGAARQRREVPAAHSGRPGLCDHNAGPEGQGFAVGIPVRSR